MLKKTLIIATLGTGLAVAAIPAQARPHDNRAAGAILGATIGALIGSSVHGGDGAIVGGMLGAVAGAGVAGSHYRGGYYTGYAPRYYAPSRGYYRGDRGYYRGDRGYYRAGATRRDLDGDGVPNRFDRAPYDPRYR
jgi:hypothetical protein